MFIKQKLFGVLLLLLSAAAITTTEATPFARIHVKFTQPPHQIQEHGITTDGGRLISQQSYLSFGRGNAPIGFDPASQQRNPYYDPINPAQFLSVPTQPQQQKLPFDGNDISYVGHESGQTTPDFSDGLAYPDPQLVVGDTAMMAVRYIYGRGQLFFHEVPHARLLLRNQQERLNNGLNGHILRSLRPGSTWLRRE